MPVPRRHRSPWIALIGAALALLALWWGPPEAGAADDVPPSRVAAPLPLPPAGTY